MWRFSLCPEKGTVNEIDVAVDSIVTSMMSAFEKEGYKWASYVDGNTEMAYSVDRV